MTIQEENALAVFIGIAAGLFIAPLFTLYLIG
jgi:hypothetical protein